MSAILLPPPNVTNNTGGGVGIVILRQEVWGPQEELTSGTRHIMRMPYALDWDEVVIEAAVVGSISLELFIKKDGVQLFLDMQPISVGVYSIPKSVWVDDSGSILYGAKMEVEISVQAPGPYDTTWEGLAVSFIKTAS